MADNNLDMLRGTVSDIFSGGPGDVSGSSYEPVDFTDLRNTIMQLTGDLVNYSIPYEGPVRPKSSNIGPGKDRIRRYDDRHATERTKEFISKIYPIMEEELDGYKHSDNAIDWVMQQLALESNYGQSDIGGSYNLAGIQAVPGNAGPGRGEVYVTRDKKVYGSIDDIPDGKEFRRFRTYDGYRDFVKNYLSLLNNRYNALTAGSHEQFIDRLHGRSASRSGIKDPGMQDKYDYSESYGIYRDSIGRYKTLQRLMNTFKANGNMFATGGDLGGDNDYTLGLSIKDAADVNDMVVEDDFIEPEVAPTNVDIDVAIANISDSIGDISEREEEVNQGEASNAAGAYTIASGLINVLRNRARTREAMQEKRQHDEWTGDVIKFGEQKNSVGKINDAFIEPEWPLVEITDAGDLKYAAELAHDTYEGIKGGNVGGSLLGAGIGAAMLALPGSIKAIDNLGGGYMLKSLMRGNPLEKQISKEGTVAVNNIRAISKKASKVDQAVIDKVLESEQFAGKKAIDYNQFRKAVQDELITYERQPDERFANYGLNRLGFQEKTKGDYAAVDFVDDYIRRLGLEEIGENTFGVIPNDEMLFRDPRLSRNVTYQDLIDMYYDGKLDVDVPSSHTYTFSSSRIPGGSSKHYDANTLGHSRTYTTSDEPDVLHVMESQSDWAQAGIKEYKDPGKRAKQLRERIERLTREISDEEQRLGARKRIDGSTIENDWEVEQLREIIQRDKETLNDANRELDRLYNQSQRAQEHYLADNYTSRQIQENLRYAAEKGQTKMRYPTRETAAKIEGYSGKKKYYDESGKEVFVDDDVAISEYEQAKYAYDFYKKDLDAILDKHQGSPDIMDADYERFTYLVDNMKQLEPSIKNGKLVERIVYPEEHETILRKYDKFPKEFNRLFNGADVRTVTDPKGNTWYEVDVPNDYLNMEWSYKYGGVLNHKLASGGKIHIKPENRGKFTALKKRTGKSASWFKAHGTPAQRKMATFALNSKKWRHGEGGYLNY